MLKLFSTSRIIACAGLLFSGISLSAANAEDLVSKPSSQFIEAAQNYAQVWSQSKLAFQKALFTNDLAEGFGQYSPRVNSTFDANERLTVYAEPVGYQFTETNGQFSYELTASFRLLNSSGQVLTEQSEFANFAGMGRSKQRDVSASMAFEFSGLPAGDYEIETTFEDKTNGALSSFTLPFSIATEN